MSHPRSSKGTSWRRSSPKAANQERRERAEKLGIVRTLPDGRIEVISPRMLQAAAELAGLGISAEAALGVAEKLKRHADGAARAFVNLFQQELWGPFEKAGHPEQDWQHMSVALEKLRPLADGYGAGDVPDRDGGGGREGGGADAEARGPRDQTGETGETEAETRQLGRNLRRAGRAPPPSGNG